MEILLPALILALIILALLVLAAPALALVLALVLPVAAVVGLARLIRAGRRPAQPTISRPPRAPYPARLAAVPVAAEPVPSRQRAPSRQPALARLRAVAREFRSDEALFAFDRNLAVVSWNEGAAKLTGIPAEAALGRPCWELLGGVDADGNRVCHAGCAGARLASRGSPVENQRLLIRTATGDRRATWLSTIAVRGGDEPLTLHLLRDEPKVAEENAEPTHDIVATA